MLSNGLKVSGPSVPRAHAALTSLRSARSVAGVRSRTSMDCERLNSKTSILTPWNGRWLGISWDLGGLPWLGRARLGRLREFHWAWNLRERHVHDRSLRRVLDPLWQRVRDVGITRFRSQLASTGRDDDKLLAPHRERTRRGVTGRGKGGLPEQSARSLVERAELRVLCRRDEHQPTAGDDRPAVLLRPGDGHASRG